MCDWWASQGGQPASKGGGVNAPPAPRKNPCQLTFLYVYKININECKKQLNGSRDGGGKSIP